MSSSATGDSSSFPSLYSDIIHKFDQLDSKITNIGRPNSCSQDEVNNEIKNLVSEIIEFSQTSCSESEKNRILQGLNLMNVVLTNRSSRLDPSTFSDFINNATSSIRQAQDAINQQPKGSPSSSSSSVSASPSEPSRVAETRTSAPAGDNQYYGVVAPGIRAAPITSEPKLDSFSPSTQVEIANVRVLLDSMKKMGLADRYDAKMNAYAPVRFAFLRSTAEKDFPEVAARVEQLARMMKSEATISNLTEIPKFAKELKQMMHYVDSRIGYIGVNEISDEKKRDAFREAFREFNVRMNACLLDLETPAINPPGKTDVMTLANLYTNAVNNNDHKAMGFILAQVGDTVGFMKGSDKAPGKPLGIEFDYSTNSVRGKAMGTDATLTETSPLFARPKEEYIFSDDTVFCEMVKYVLDNVDMQTTDVDAVVDMLSAYFVQYKSEADPQHAARGHGQTMGQSLAALEKNPLGWRENGFDFKKTGCGCTMRNAVMGAHLSKLEDIDKLIELSLKSSYITHTSPIGFLGGVSVALSAALKEQGVPLAKIPFIVAELTKKGGKVYKLAQQIVKINPDQKAVYEKQWEDCDHVAQYYLNTRFVDGKFSLENCPDTPNGGDWMLTQLTLDKKGSSYPGQIGSDGKLVPPREVGGTFTNSIWGASDGISAYWNSEDMYLRTINDLVQGDPGSIDTINREQVEERMSQADEATRKKMYYGIIERSALHGGDSDSTATVAMFFYGQSAGKYALPPNPKTGSDPAVRFLRNLENPIFYAPKREFISSSSSSSASAAASPSVSEVSRGSFDVENYPVGTVIKQNQIFKSIERADRRDAPLKKGDTVFYDRGNDEFIVGKILEGEEAPKGLKVDLGVHQDEVPPSTRILRGAGGRGGAFFNGIYRLK